MVLHSKKVCLECRETVGDVENDDDDDEKKKKDDFLIEVIKLCGNKCIRNRIIELEREKGKYY